MSAAGPDITTSFPHEPDTVNLVKVHIPFIVNAGQVADTENVSFYAQTFAGTIYAGKDGLTYVFPINSSEGGWVVRESFGEGGVSVPVAGTPSPATVNYFIGNDSSRWRTDIPTYNDVSFGEVVKGIHVTVRAYGKNVEKLFTIDPETDPATLTVHVKGADGVSLSDTGGLRINTGAGTIGMTKPVAYQMIDGEKVPVDVTYDIKGEDTYGFTTQDYDPSYLLVIDPLLASTYLGSGTSSGADYPTGLVINATNGDVYVCGYVVGTDFPTTPGAYQLSYKGTFPAQNGVISRFNNTLSSLISSTYFGGNTSYAQVMPSDIGLDSAGNVYVAGITTQFDYPTTAGAYCRTQPGPTTSFISKFPKDLTTLSASTFLGGSIRDDIDALTITGTDIFVTGWSSSPNFPTTAGAYCRTYNSYDVFISRLDTGLSTLNNSTFLGGGGGDYGYAIDIDASGNVFVTGETNSGNGTSISFPTTSGAFCRTYIGSNNHYTGFVSNLSYSLSTLQASTYFGGSSGGSGGDTIVASGSDVFVAGTTFAADFPSRKGSYCSTYITPSTNGNGFIVRFPKTLTSLTNATFHGNETQVNSITASGTDIYVTGFTKAPVVPVTLGAYKTSYQGLSYMEGFVSRYNQSLSSLNASTYLGGSNDDNPKRVKVFGGNVYILGSTVSTDFPTTTGAYDTAYNGGSYDMFVSKLDSALSAPVTDVSFCKEISSPGTYTLQTNILNSSATVCINIIASDVTFDGNGYTIDGIDTTSTTGIYAYNSSKTLQNVNIRNVTLTDWSDGLVYWNVNSSRIENTTANSNSLGIHILSGSDYLKLVNNNASLNTAMGFSIGSAYADIDHNTAIGNTNYGIAITSNLNNFIHENTISGVPYMGILIQTGNNTIANNTISGLGNWGGIFLSGAFTRNNLIVNNSISKFHQPIFIDSAYNNTIVNNYFNNTYDGVYFYNTIYSNTWNTTKTSGTNIIGGSFLGGNYWANTSGTAFSQTCTDVNGDGICDSAYTIASGNIDNLPLTNNITGAISAPVANFTATPRSGTAPLMVSFTDLSLNSTGWAWFFGDENFTAPWTQQNASAGWSARMDHSSVAMPDGSIVLMGGWDGINKDDTWRSINNGITWTQVNASSGWKARADHTSVVMPDGSIVLMGGSDTSDKYNDVWRSLDSGATWALTNASAGWSARYKSSSVAMPDGSIVLMGGWDGSDKNDVWRSIDSGATWALINASAGWSARMDHSSVAMPDGSIVLMGGWDGINKNDTWRSIDKGTTWTRVNASSGWSARRDHTSVTMPDGSIVLMGGKDDNSANLNDVWRSIDSGATWALMNASSEWGVRNAHSSVAMPDGSIVLTGGWYGGYTNDVWRFNPVGSSAQNPSHTYTTAGIYNVALHAFNTGGYNSTRKAGYITVTGLPVPIANFTATPRFGTAPLPVSFTDLSLNSTGRAWFFGDESYTQPWTQVNASAGWSARSQHSSVAMPDGSIVLMGGYGSSSGYMNDTWRSPDNGTTWTNVNASGGWTARYDHTSVAMPDGSIVLMGGYDGGNYKNDVWLSTDNGAMWRQVNASAGWSARTGHSSVAMADGSIVLMGGTDGSNYNNDTWRSTDNGTTWTNVTVSAGWTARYGHRSVAMSDGSIVLMGGQENGNRYNDTWRSTDKGATWTNITGSPGWTARQLHRSVAMPDGSIVLMGGEDGTVSMNDVWRSTDNGATWTQVNASAGWSGRYSHSSVAMPDGSIVLMGGAEGLGLTKNDVWRFNPTGSSAQNPSHTYTAAGIYNVTLQAFNTGGYNSTRKVGYISVSAGGSTPPPGWKFRADAENTGVYDDGGIAPTNNVLWTFTTGGVVQSSPAVTNGVVYVGSNGNKVYAIDASTGAQIWNFTTGGSVDSSPAVTNGVVYIGSIDNKVYAIDASTGAQIWNFTTGGGVESSPAVANGVVYVGCNDNKVYAINADTGTEVWSLSVVGGTRSSPAVANGVVYIGGGDAKGKVYAINANTGAQVWNFTTGIDPEISSPAVANGVVYFGSHDHNVYAINANTGAQVWNFTTGDFMDSSPSVANGTVYIAGGGSTVYAINTTTGAQIWNLTTGGGAFLSSPAVANGVVYVGSGYDVYALGGTPTGGGIVANFTATPLFGTAPLPVSFTDSSTGSPTGWAWFFGDENWTVPAWTEMTASAEWAARNYLSSVAMPDGSIVLMGGNDGTIHQHKNDVWRSTDNGTTWTNITTSGGWSGRFAHSSVAMPDGSIVLTGGVDSVDYKNDVWRSMDNGATWAQMTASAGWSAKYGHTSVAMPDGSIVLMGGWSPSGGNKNDTWRSTDNGGNWSLMNVSSGWSARKYHSSVAMPDGSIVLMGGDDGTVSMNDTWRSTDNGGNWSLMTASAGWTIRNSHSSVAMPDGSIVLMGGYDGSVLKNDVWRSTDNGGNWSLMNVSSGWSERFAHSSVAMPDGSIVLMGGSDGSWKNDVWRFVPTGSSAQNPSHTYTVAGRYQVSLQAYNAGGYNSTRKAGYITVTGLPAPVADFTAIPLSGTAPLPVSFTDSSTGSPTGWAWFFGDESYTQPWTQQTASAGWTGREGHSSVIMPDGSIVLMGGYDFDGPGDKNDVWRSADNGTTWTLVNASAGWTARDSHSSVVTPDGSIVLMGGNDGISRNDVWRSADKGATWTLVNASAGWTGRSGHSSVATPDGSIVLMGGNDGISRNDVWRSVDKGATWTLVNASAGWTGRIQHSSVVMTDGSIVLMGGIDGIGFNFKNDTWWSADNGTTWTQQTPNAGWTARGFHSSVSMPDGSIVLMGGDSVIDVSQNDTWRSVDKGATWTLVNASAGWTARRQYSSVSMPDGSIVLMGGRIYGAVTNDTWRFVPTGASAQNPSHTYTTAGTYSVALQVYNAGGYNSTRNAGYIDVTSGGGGPAIPAPVAAFHGTPPLTGPLPLDVTFTDDSTGIPTGWAWFFGDESYTQAWTQVNASSGWSARNGHRSVAMPDGSIVLTGGGYGGDKNDTWRSTNNGATWTLMNASSGWSQRFAHSTVVIPDGSIVLMGGHDGSYKNDVWRSTNNGATWTLMNAGATWAGRYDHSSVAMPDGSIVLMGGSGGDYKNDVWRSTDNGTTWALMNSSAWSSGRFGQRSVAMPDGSIVLTGGAFGGSGLNDTWRSTNSGATWTEMNVSSGWSARWDHGLMAMPDGSIVLTGGQTVGSAFANDTWRSTDNGATWTQVNPSTGWADRQVSSVAMPDGSIILMGGYDSGGASALNDTWRFVPTGSSAQNPSHTYTAAGTYSVALQAYNAGGYNSTRKAGYITVNSPPYIDVSVNGTISNWNFVTGPNVNTTGANLTINTNINLWNVYARDALDGGSKPVGTEGNMAEWTGSSYVPSGNVLLNAVKVNYDIGSPIILSGTNQIITSGTSPGTHSGDLRISQLIAPTDPALDTGHEYRIVVTFTGSAS